MPFSSTRRLITVLLLVSFATFSVAAQDTKRTPDEKPRKIKQTEKRQGVVQAPRRLARDQRCGPALDARTFDRQSHAGTR